MSAHERTRECRVHACREQHPDTEVMCERHWAMVPEELRREVERDRRRVEELGRKPFPGPREADQLLNATQDRQESESTAIGEVEVQEDEARRAKRKAAKAKAKDAAERWDRAKR